MSKARIIELQRALKIARDALGKIRDGYSRDPQAEADDALYRMMPLENKRPLQGLVGHEPRSKAHD
jgi:hypothetical protein